MTEKVISKNLFISVFIIQIVVGFSFLYAQSLNVYPPVPGLAASEFYSFRVRQVGSNVWQTPFAWITRCIESNPINDESKYYSKYLGGWSNTYINFEMSNNTQIEVEISKKNGSNITKAAAHPQHKVVSCNVTDGKAYVVIKDPALFAVDIDGQMDDQNTGRLLPEGWGGASLYSGPPIHTVTIFANPIITDKPSISDPDVYVVNPGDQVNPNFSQSTIYFKPGVHDVGKNFQVHANKSYFIPGDAILYGALNNNLNFADGNKIRIFGHGTLSGARIPHPEIDKALLTDHFRYKPISISGASNIRVEGITIADSPNHSLMLPNSYDPANPNYIRWVKIFTWRANGDGINPFGNVGIEDCFIRTQDDCLYTNGLGMKRIVLWTDANGSAFVLSPHGRISNPNLIIEDCDIIYSRSVFYPNGKGGSIFNARAEGGPNSNQNPLTFRNIRIEDKHRTREVFNLKTEVEGVINQPPGDLMNIVFENVSVAGLSITGAKEMLWGNASGPIHDLTFKDVVFEGSPPIFDVDNFTHNEFVYDLKFQFSGITWNLTTTPATGGSINPSGRKYPNGAKVTVKAIPNLGYEFTGWSGDLTGTTNPAVVIMDNNKSISANFKSASTYTLSVNALNAIVELTPAGGIYNPGTVVKILIKPNLGYVFSGWSGDITGIANPATITINSNKTINATLTSVQVYKLTATASGGTVTFEPAGPQYTKGTFVKVTAKADPGFVFSSWSGDPLNDDFYVNPNSIIMDSDKNIAANFVAQVGVPTISFVKPLDGEKITEPANLVVNVDAKTTAGGSISNVKLYINDLLIRQENTAPYDWNSTGDAALRNLPKGIYVLRADATDNIGKIGSKSIKIYVGNVTGLEQGQALPKQTTLNQNYPNPFNPETTISYNLAEPSHARLTIWNTLGQEVIKLIDRDHSAGHYFVRWNGKDNTANKVASGVYFYLLEVNNSVYTKKLFLLK